MSTPEGLIQAAVLTHLQSKNIFCWRQNNNAVWDPKMNGYRAHNGLKGVSDIICVVKGVFTACEIKTPKGRQSADQLLFQKRLERNGGVYHLIRSVEQIKVLFP